MLTSTAQQSIYTYPSLFGFLSHLAPHSALLSMKDYLCYGVCSLQVSCASWGCSLQIYPIFLKLRFGTGMPSLPPYSCGQVQTQDQSTASWEELQHHMVKIERRGSLEPTYHQPQRRFYSVWEALRQRCPGFLVI